ncbi:YutD family protein [Lacticaseibacillus brantae]|uniref:Transcriptional regulator n=1 Tax=Lacticaseibacillus brantae DSM 23927 TaxID=1423727 RepID=A0A0R2AXX8_9LACO|nr:YutD family protein [Lacticaseibacillus brantae]KRM71578.1 transcriptional regulator [Lacticaseibacillus brantae DSM 23927]
MTTETQAPLESELAQLVTPETTSRVVRQTSEMITIDQRRYQIDVDVKQAFDAEALDKRYNDILDKYDYIVGDWGYDQLRLRGFYKAGNRHANKDQLIDTLEDYLYEYCNFGCAYFVLARIDAPAKPANNRRPRAKGEKPRSNNKPKQAPKANAKPYSEKRARPKKVQGEAKTTGTKPRKRHFTIRQRETETK